jgi:tetratricopeptide (TPR) repeat protein
MIKDKFLLTMLSLLAILTLSSCASTTPQTTAASSKGEASSLAGGERNPAAAEATRNVGEAYLVEGNLIAALRELKKAEQLNPDDHVTHYDLGLVYLSRQRYDQAIQHFERAVQLKPDYAPAINSLGNAYAAKQDWDKAIQAYEKIVEDAFYGTPYFALSNLGLAYYHKNDFVQAEKYFVEALKLSPDFVQALGGLGMTYNAMGRYSEAVVRLSRAVQKDPKFAPLHFQLGRAYRGLNNKGMAQTEFQQVLKLAPDSPLALEAQKELKKLNP